MRQLTSDTASFQEIFRAIESSILSFCNITKLPVTFYDNTGEIKCEYDSKLKICKHLELYNAREGICRKNLRSAIKTAANLGEPYIFVCNSGLIQIAITLIVGEKTVGCFVAGPLILERLSPRTISNMIALNGNSNGASISRMLMLLKDMSAFTTKEVSSLATLLRDCVTANIPNSDEYAKVNTKYREQTEVGLALQGTKLNHNSISYPFELESSIIKSMRASDPKAAEEYMLQLFNAILLLGSGNLDFIKIRLTEICTVLSRAAMDSGWSMNQMFTINADYINALAPLDSIEALRTWAAELIRDFCRNIFTISYSGESQIIKKAIELINQDVGFTLSLADLAEALHVNASYLSFCFKKEMHVHFTDYINALKIKKGKDLLEKTNLRLVDVALSAGFEDQSYFTKVFKKEVGCTPSEYRNKL